MILFKDYDTLGFISLYFLFLSTDDYDDVQPISEDFPPPPPEIRYLFISVPLNGNRK